MEYKAESLDVSGDCCIFDNMEISRQVFQQHFTSFGFSCCLFSSFDELFKIDKSVTIAVVAIDEDSEERKARIAQLNSRFKIALCRLRSPNEIRVESTFDVTVSRYIKRDSLRNVVHQLLTSGNAIQPASRQEPYCISCLY